MFVDEWTSAKESPAIILSTIQSVAMATMLTITGRVNKRAPFRSHLTITMCFFLSSCVNSYIDDNATHL